MMLEKIRYIYRKFSKNLMMLEKIRYIENFKKNLMMLEK